MQSVLILGSQGMLGQALVQFFSSKGVYEVIGWDREDLDISDEKLLREKVTELWPDYILNACAYNAVDLCEVDDAQYQKALNINGYIPGVLAGIAKDLQSVFVHYSTDYVFDGECPRYRYEGRAPGCCGSGCSGCSYRSPDGTFDGYREVDAPNPISRYGKTKYEGEKSVEKEGDHYYIFRLSKLFGIPGTSSTAKKSFFEIISERAKNKEEIRLVDDEISCFTYAPDLAQKTEEILTSGLAPGIYHLINQGAETWYSAGKKYFETANISADLRAVSSKEFKRNALRPKQSTLISTKTVTMRHWENALLDYMKYLA